MKPVRIRWKMLIFLCLIICGLITILTILKSCQSRSYFRIQAAISFLETMQLDWNVVLDHNQECFTPSLHPFDNTILSYVTMTERLRCEWHQPLITFVDTENILRFNQSALLSLGYNLQSLWCYYKPIWSLSDDVVQYGDEQLMTGRDVMETDFVSVSCSNLVGVTVYRYTHAYPRKLTEIKNQRQQNVDDHKLSCLVFILDSLSRLNALRQLQKTYYFLTHTMKGVVLKGFNKVGDNTWPNILPMLTGRQIETNEVGKSDYVDDFALVWRNFSDAGYVTMFAEDMPEFAVFNYYTKGFRTIPTDHYMRPFWIAAKSSELYETSQPLCYASVPRHRILMDYLSDFAIRYSKTPYFAFTHLTEIGHEFMNRFGACDDDLANFLQTLYYGGHLSHTVLFLLGDHGARFDPLRATYAGRVEDNMPLAAVYLPIKLKEKFPEISTHLRRNANLLTSMFDIHETFMDILSYANRKQTKSSTINSKNTHFTQSTLMQMKSAKRLSNAKRLEKLTTRNIHNKTIYKSVYDTLFNRSELNTNFNVEEHLIEHKTTSNTQIQSNFKKYSIFSEIPITRTCDNAGIIPQYCSCGEETLVNLLDTRVTTAALAVVDKINSLIVKYQHICALLRLHKVHSVTVINLKPNKPSLPQPNITSVRVILESVPGGGLFEAVVQFKTGSAKPEVSNEISRVNRFMGQDTCISTNMLRDFDFRKYCYCGHVMYLRWAVGI